MAALVGGEPPESTRSTKLITLTNKIVKVKIMINGHIDNEPNLTLNS